MSKTEDKIIDVIAWVIVASMMLISAIGGCFLWLGAKLGLVKK